MAGDDFLEDDFETVRRLIGPKKTPQKIGRYEIVNVIGKGGMGKVYKAYDPDLERLVAIKVLENETKEEQKRHVIKEARSTARLQHPNIVTLYEVGIDDERPYLVMEYISGVTLAERVREKIPSFEQSLKWIQKMANAIHLAHKQGIIHRDIKPSNIMLMDEETPKIMDFGLAKMMDIQTSTSSRGMMIGTPSYMSPEQVNADTQKVDQRTDVYGLGAVLYELLTGKIPFDGRNTLEIVIQVSSKEAVPPRQINPLVPSGAEAICLKCLQKDPQKRYQSAYALAYDIKRYLTQKEARGTLRPRFSPRLAIPIFLAIGIFAYLGVVQTIPFSKKDRFAPRLSKVQKKANVQPNVPSSIPGEKVSFGPSRNERNAASSHTLEGEMERIWENIETSGFQGVEQELEFMGQTFSDQALLYHDWGNLYFLQALRSKKERRTWAARALSKFDRAMEISPGECAAAFFAYQVASYYNLKKDGQNYIDFLCRAKEQYKLYFMARERYLSLFGKKDVTHIRKISEEAMGFCDEAIKWDPRFAEVFLLKAKISILQEEYRKAIPFLQKGIEIACEKAPAYKKGSKRWLRPLYLDLYLSQGQCHRSLLDNEKAVAFYSRILEWEERSTMACLNRGKCYFEMGRYEESIRDFSNSLEDEEDAEEGSVHLSYRMRAEAYLAQQRYEEAFQDCNRLIELKPGKPEGYILRANVHQARNQYSQAIQDIEKASLLSPSKTSLFFLKANLYNLMEQARKKENVNPNKN